MHKAKYQLKFGSHEERYYLKTISLVSGKSKTHTSRNLGTIVEEITGHKREFYKNCELIIDDLIPVVDIMVIKSIFYKLRKMSTNGK